MQLFVTVTTKFSRLMSTFNLIAFQRGNNQPSRARPFNEIKLKFFSLVVLRIGTINTLEYN